MYYLLEYMRRCVEFSGEYEEVCAHIYTVVYTDVCIVLSGIYVRHSVQHCLSLILRFVLTLHCRM